MLISDCVKKFLELNTHSDLAALYSKNIEMQLIVSKDQGNKVEGDFKGKGLDSFTDGLTTWYPIRIPKNANKDPEDNDREATFDIAEHTLGIGLTGWDWLHKKSKWVFFDFDSLIGHSNRHVKKLTDIELKEIEKAVVQVPWVTLRKSTSGNGLHIYIFLEDVPTNTHTEHAALARYILGMLSAQTGCDLEAKIDACISFNTWILTSKGPRQVKELINTPFNIITSGQKYKTDGFFNTGQKELFEIETIEGYKFQATSNHLVLVDYPLIDIKAWQEVQNLEVGDYLHLDKHKDIEWDGDGTWEEGYILGWLFGDGSIAKPGKKYNPRLIFYPDKFSQIPIVIRCFENEIAAVYNEKKNYYTITSEEIERLTVKFGIDYTKSISEYVEKASSDFYKGFISAFFDTDGHADKTYAKVILSQSNLPRLEAVQRMLLRLGIKSIIYERKKRNVVLREKIVAQKKIPYILSIANQNVLIFNRRIGFTDQRKRNDILRSIENRPKFYYNEKFTVRIKSIKSVGKELVYDIKVPDVNAFDANGLYIHNCGGIGWVYHRKMIGTEGLVLIKQGEKLANISSNWKEHIPVITGKKKRVIPGAIETPEEEKLFLELTSQRNRIEFDDEHKRLISYLQDNGYCCNYNQDLHLIVTHTHALKQAHNDLKLKGVFETLAEGSQRGDWNVYSYPNRNGSWTIKRFTLGVAEASCWFQDSNGYTSCLYNVVPDLKTACKIYGGLEDTKKGFVFLTAEKAQEAALLLGVDLKLPVWALGKETILRKHEDGRLLVKLKYDSKEDLLRGGITGYTPESKHWIKLFSTRLEEPNEIETINFDNVIRHLLTPTGKDCGWSIKVNTFFQDEPLSHVSKVLKSMGYKSIDVEIILGKCIVRAWRLVNLPFQPEYLQDRQWNRNAAQLRFAPLENKDNLHYPTWLKLLNHIGKNLDSALKTNKWAVENNVLTGADYLKIWISSLFQFPTERLPYLFLYGAEFAGKTAFHEAISLLITNGVKRVDTAILSQGNFTSELENAILCVVEDKSDLKKNKNAFNKIKDWVTSSTITIHKKGLDPFDVTNTTHFCVDKNEWVMTLNGPKQVRWLINIPTTIIYQNRYIKTDGFFSTGMNELFEVETIEGFKIKVTKDHPLLVNLSETDQQFDFPLSELKVGNELCLCKHKNIEWDGEGNWNEGYILGYLVGDGTITEKKNLVSNSSYQSRITMYYPDFCLQDFLCSLFPIYPEVHINTHIKKSGDLERVVISSPYLEQLRIKYGLDQNKEINPYLLNTSSDFYEGFISGFMDSDGTVTDFGPRLTQNNVLRLEMVQLMLIHLGISSRLQRAEHGYLAITKTNVFEFNRRIGFQHPEKNYKLKQFIKGKHWTHNESFTVRIKSITSIGIHETFNVHVPKVEHFSLNGISVHNCQTSNYRDACPIFGNDTRVTVIQVDELTEEDRKDVKQFWQSLEKEAPDFITSVLSLEIPKSNDRLSVPIIITDEKLQIQESNLSELERFIKDILHVRDGEMVKFSDFYDRFLEYIEPNEVGNWSKIRVSRELSTNFPVGKLRRDLDARYIGNLSFSPPDENNGNGVKKSKLIIKNEHLVSSV